MIKNIFDICFLCYKSGYQSVGFLPHALPYMLVCHTGELLVYSVAPASLSSPTYAGKVGEFQNFGGDEMLKLMGHKDAFYFRLGAGQAALLPQARVVSIICRQDAAVFRWPVWPQPEAQDVMCTSVLSACTGLVASYPDVATADFRSWLSLLQEKLATARGGST